MIPWLTPESRFPPLNSALLKPNGLLAAGGDLSPQRLIEAYRCGIFPWFNEGEPILWWSPDPRMVLFPGELKISRSLRKTLKKSNYEIRVDSAFREVMQACAAPRGDQPGTWIHAGMISAYAALHEMGVAHSVEVWMRGELMGGLYGVALGKVFFGESMFSRISNASKIAFVHLVRQLERRDFHMIDCQMKTAHLASLGGREISRHEFGQKLKELVNYTEQVEKWCFDHEPIE
ncbi:leucyl/phenylalanyl-tRNA--protein transferase [Nitrosospira lacus]|uniref:Leucyl/phenylalanyl-tRNA--protein transferase n=1 Tax=Nitrosospira lacus TaxID=1288494 RepID=A0A1W6SLX8_9PROT|nr:leucyl/phenylalanyl-tRNA--protein transferase [Nitrosospira lacus]ARO86797.1 leucyl/phenylalanyl-tRNA--protein transferase [Nitrosospira lacus]